MAVYQRKDTKARRWFYKFTIDGVTYKKAIPTARTKREAEAAERTARRDVHEGTYGIPKDILFSEFVNKHYLPWAEQHRKGAVNIRYRASVFCEFFKGYTLRQIGPIMIEKYKLNRLKMPMEQDTKRTRRPSTINTELITLSAIFTRAKSEGRIRENPCHKVEKLPIEERKPRVLVLEEEPRLLKAAESGPFYLAPVIKLGLWLGWRENELLHIRRRDIDFIRNRIYVSRAKWAKDPRLTKGVPMSGAVRELLFQLVEQAKGDYIFARPQTGKPYLRGCLQIAFKTACRKAKIEGLRFHDLRHTFGTRLGEADTKVQKIKRLMGHSDIKTTLMYVHTSEEALEETMELASKLGEVAESSSKIVPHKRRAG